jgi:Zn-dependent M28 family amino/carboxypeptidase
MSIRCLLVAALGLAACSSKSTSSSAPSGPVPMAKLPDIDAAAALRHIKMLSSDKFEGRAPGTKGEELTVAYLTEQFKAVGLEPGNPDGTYVQKVPLVGTTPVGEEPLVVGKGDKPFSLKRHDEVVAFSERVTDSVALEGSEIVFVGYGVQAPEFKWDDFEGMDIKGKTVIMLVNDPPVTDGSGQLDAKLFGGKAMTYYGRWTYKYEKAAELGAAAVFVVHETEAAGYPFAVAQSFADERFGLVTPDKNMGKPAVQGWLSQDAATRLLAHAGQDFQKLKAQAATREFKPVPLGTTASMSFRQTMRQIESRNVVGKLTGSDDKLKDEFIIYTAHWDHLGVGDPKDGDKIYNGASDNASGTAAIIEIARAMKKVRPPPKRSILFLAVTAEEHGLLGSEYYSKFPLYPLSKTLAAINSDNNLPMWGRTLDAIVIGLGASDMDDYARAAAAEQGRTVRPDAEPEKGFFYRSDHFQFAKSGVPALNLDEGKEYRDRPADFGRKKSEYYIANDYHSQSDEVKPDWDLAGYAEQAKLLMTVGYRVAMADKFPEWRPGNEFRAAGEARLKK